MPEDHEILALLLGEASLQSRPFQSLIRDYSCEVMTDPEVHRAFAERLEANPAMQREIDILKASLPRTCARTLSPAMQEVLAAALALPAGSHTSPREIGDLVAIELVYKLRETAGSSSEIAHN